jgi:predicted acylesterase/phospholipase RssA
VPLRPTIGSRKAAGVVRAIDDTNFAINLLSSTAAGALVAAVTLATAENRDKEMQRLMEVGCCIASKMHLPDCFRSNNICRGLATSRQLQQLEIQLPGKASSGSPIRRG